MSAVLVDYLSNTATLTGTVSSPLLVELDGNLDIYAGETAVINQTITNLANTNIPANIYNTVTNPSGITCAEFMEIKIDGISDIHACSEIDSNTVMIFVNGTNMYTPNMVEKHNYELTLYHMVVGDYSFNTVMV